MLQSSIRVPVTRIITPLCRGLLKLGLTANWVSVIGGVGSTVASIILFGTGHYFLGSCIVAVLVLFDLLDGTMARLSTGGSKWGALLDSTLDRISDAALLASIALHLSRSQDPLVPLILTLLILSSMISYIKARAEGLGIECNGGIAERTERLILILLTTALHGLGVHFALPIGFGLVTVLSVITVFQRLWIVYRAAKL